MGTDHKLELKDAVPLRGEFRFARPVSWRIAPHENWAVAGPNGSGKSMLTDILLRRIPLKEGSVSIRTEGAIPDYRAVKAIGFRDIYSIIDTREAFYQQRWNADAREATPLAGSLLESGNDSRIKDLLERFSLERVLEKHVVSLSSGELRKLLVIRALAARPEILVIDNPYVGLDAASRDELSRMLGILARDGGTQFILIVSDPRDIPPWVDKILPVMGMNLMEPLSAEEFRSAGLPADLFAVTESAPVPPYVPDPADRYETVAHLDRVSVRYGEKIILDRLDWHVCRGEKWALLGANGTGKSTLLSLLYGDNPQAYANRITLFDRPRGTGESIWEIKRRIGYLSSDIHSYYLKDIPVLDVVMSGFYDTVGLYSADTPEQQCEATAWLNAFGAGHLAARKFINLSFGEQRLVMLARTLVKRPPVVILDEPMHGLDAGNRERAQRVIETYCTSPDITLIYVTHYSGEIPGCVDRVKKL